MTGNDSTKDGKEIAREDISRNRFSDGVMTCRRGDWMIQHWLIV